MYKDVIAKCVAQVEEILTEWMNDERDITPERISFLAKKIVLNVIFGI